MKLEFDTNVLKNEGKIETEKLPGGVEGFKKQLSGYHVMAKGTGQNMVKPMVPKMVLFIIISINKAILLSIIIYIF